jgi:hypothetical protein
MPAKDVSYLELRVYAREQGEERTWRVAGCGRAQEPRDWMPPAGSKLRRFRVALMPEHIELRRDPILLRIICTAKHIAGLPQAGWCPQ